MSCLALSGLFEYYSMASINMYFFQFGDILQMSESDVYRRHILTSKIGPLTKRILSYAFIVHYLYMYTVPVHTIIVIQVILIGIRAILFLVTNE